MNERNMYYNTYGYEGFTPINQGNGGIPIPIYQNQQTIPNNYTTSQINDMNERINRLERQTKRLEQRLIRLETPYANTNNFNQEPDNNMYMM